MTFRIMLLWQEMREIIRIPGFLYSEYQLLAYLLTHPLALSTPRSTLPLAIGHSTVGLSPPLITIPEHGGSSNCVALSPQTSCTSGEILDSFSIALSQDFTEDTDMREIVFTSRTYQAPAKYVSTTCVVQLEAVDVVVSCIGKSCAVSMMRISSFKPNSTTLTVLENMPLVFAYANPAWPEIPAEMSSTIENWIVNPSMPILKGQYFPGGTSGLVNVSKVPLDVFSARFAMAFNTFSYVGIGGVEITSSLPAQFSSVDSSTPTISAPGTTYTMRTVYRCSWGWLAVLLISCVIVIALILTEIYLARLVVGPDILGYVSTVTHGGSAAAPKEAVGGSAIDGAQRTRLLAREKVRLQDIQPQEPVGKIALVPGDGAPLVKGRKYL